MSVCYIHIRSEISEYASVRQPIDEIDDGIGSGKLTVTAGK